MEGAEADVLRGADFTRFRPKVIVVEAIKPFTLKPAWDEWEPLLAAHGYTYVWDDELNRYYVAEEAPRACGHGSPTARSGTRTVRRSATTRRRGRGAATSGPSALRCCCAALDMAALPLSDPDAFFDMLTAERPRSRRPATAADIAAIITTRLFGRLRRNAAHGADRW